MSDTSYEQNIADRLRNRFDGSLLDQWGANVIEQLLAENEKLKARSVPVEPTPEIVRAYESFDNISQFWPAMIALIDG